jgi:hypothetical protein
MRRDAAPGGAPLVNPPAEPPAQRLVNLPPADDAGSVAHLLNILAATILFYAAVTRASLVFALVLARIVRP